MLLSGAAAELPVEQRRVLALVNGQRTVKRLGEQLLDQQGVEQALAKLLERQLISSGAEEPAAPGKAAPSGHSVAQPAASGDVAKARKIMVNTLKTFANSFRNAKLLKAIMAATTIEELREQVDPWYEALNDNPEGAVRADDFRAELMKLL